MGFYSGQGYSEGDQSEHLRPRMISVIKAAYPTRLDVELQTMPFESLRGLYGRATQVINEQETNLYQEVQEDKDDWEAYREEEALNEGRQP